MDVPHTKSGRMPAAVKVRNTPMCAQPLAAPLPKTKPTLGRLIACIPSFVTVE
jgi:hypothetical protein